MMERKEQARSPCNEQATSRMTTHLILKIGLDLLRIYIFDIIRRPI